MKKSLIIFAHMFIGWAICGAIMGIGMSLMPTGKILIIHAVAAPIIFGLISLVYFKKFAYTTPLKTAIIFTVFIMAMDFFLVALVINKSLAMFASILGTWIPFALIFFSTYFVGLKIYKVK